ncbi:La- protein 7 [Rhizophlyctis rosea]|nr:La- protein 7 [Rhizophlyctis rosea]
MSDGNRAPTQSGVSQTDQGGFSTGDPLDAQILKQVEFYFSDHNLLTDNFLRSLISQSPTKEVELSVLTTFPRMRSICTDIPTIASILRKSTRLLINKHGTRVRRRFPFTGKKSYNSVCKNYAAGNCKYGAKCRFKHERPESPLGGWTPVEPAEEDMKKGSLKRDDRDSPAKRQRTDDASESQPIQSPPQPSSTSNSPAAPAAINTTPCTTPAIDLQSHFPSPISDPAFIAKLQSWGAAHFGPSARFPLPTSTELEPNENNGWDTLCHTCHSYWTDYYEQQGWVAVDGGEEEQVPMEEEVDTNNGYDGEEDEYEDEEYEDEEGLMVNLTPGMIEMFRHAENWRRERDEMRQAEAQAEKEAEVNQEAVDVEEDILATPYEKLEAQYGPAAAYQLRLLEMEVEKKFDQDVETKKPALWPVVPIRW